MKQYLLPKIKVAVAVISTMIVINFILLSELFNPFNTEKSYLPSYYETVRNGNPWLRGDTTSFWEAAITIIGFFLIVALLFKLTLFAYETAARLFAKNNQ